jgi:hypothetical protein
VFETDRDLGMHQAFHSAFAEDEIIQVAGNNTNLPELVLSEGTFRRWLRQRFDAFC